MNIYAKSLGLIIALGMTSLSGILYAHDECEYMMEQLDERFDGKPELDEETIVDEEKTKTILELRLKAEEYHHSGKHEEAVELLDAAIELVDNLD